MSNETEFVNGLIVKAPNDNAPEYVKAKLSFKIVEMIAWLEARRARGDEWANADIKVSQNEKWYAAVDNWKPNGNGKPRQEAAKPQEAFDDSNIPF